MISSSRSKSESLISQQHDNALTISNIHGSPSEQFSKLSFALIALVAPTITVLLALVPSDLSSEQEFYNGSTSTGVITAFWVLIITSTFKTHLFLQKLQHVWGLEFLANELRTANILVQWEGGPDKQRWKCTASDYFSLVFYAGCSVELVTEGKTTEAMALALQMCFTMRNSFESLLQRPSQQAQRLWHPESNVTIVSEALVAEVVSNMNTDKSKLKDFNRENFIEEVKRRREEGYIASSSENLKGGGYWEQWIPTTCIRFPSGVPICCFCCHRKHLFREYWCSRIISFHLPNPFNWWFFKITVELGELHTHYKDIVLARMGLCWFVGMMLQNGQLMLMLAVGINKLTGAKDISEEVGDDV